MLYLLYFLLFCLIDLTAVNFFFCVKKLSFPKMSLEFIERYNLKTIVPGKHETKLDCVKKLTHLYMNGRFIENIVRFLNFLNFN